MSEQAAVRVCDYKGGVTPNISYLDMSVAHAQVRGHWNIASVNNVYVGYIIAHRTFTGNF